MGTDAGFRIGDPRQYVNIASSSAGRQEGLYNQTRERIYDLFITFWSM